MPNVGGTNRMDAMSTTIAAGAPLSIGRVRVTNFDRAPETPDLSNPRVVEALLNEARVTARNESSLRRKLRKSLARSTQAAFER